MASEKSPSIEELHIPTAKTEASTIRDKFVSLFLVSLNTRINGPGTRYGLAVLKERKRHLEKYLGTIHPYSYFRWYWDILMTFVLIFSLVEKPMQIAFYSTKDHDYTSVILVSSFTSFIFFLDIAFNFCTGIPDMKSDSVILDRKIIMRKYFKSWFFVDFLSSIPFDTLYYLISLLNIATLTRDHEFYFKIIRLLGLLKVFRLIRVIQCLKRIEKAFQISEIHIRLINLLVTILTICHWLSCWHWLVADLFNPPHNRNALSWISKTKLWDKPVWLCYISAALRAISNMGCAGYGGGDTPEVPEDIVATLVSIMIGATCFALYVGTMTSIVNSMHAPEKKFESMIMEVNAYMKFRNVPPGLQKRVKTYFDQRYRKQYFNERAILHSISDALRTEVLMYNCKHLVEKVPLFKDLPHSFLKMIVEKLKFEVYLPRDLIIEEGSEGQAMYFIQEGKVKIKTEKGELVSTLESGDYFGEGALISDSHKTNANVVAKEYCDIYRLDKEDFIDIFRGHPEILDELKLVAKKRDAETKRKISTSKLPNFNVTDE